MKHEREQMRSANARMQSLLERLRSRMGQQASLAHAGIGTPESAAADMYVTLGGSVDAQDAALASQLPYHTQPQQLQPPPPPYPKLVPPAPPFSMDGETYPSAHPGPQPGLASAMRVTAGPASSGAQGRHNAETHAGPAHPATQETRPGRGGGRGRQVATAGRGKGSSARPPAGPARNTCMATPSTTDADAQSGRVGDGALGRGQGGGANMTPRQPRDVALAKTQGDRTRRVNLAAEALFDDVQTPRELDAASNGISKAEGGLAASPKVERRSAALVLRLAELRSWLQQCLQIELPPGDLPTLLEDGHLLLSLVDVAMPGVAAPYANASPERKVAAVATALRQLGVREEEIIQYADLAPGPQRCAEAVANALSALAREASARKLLPELGTG